ncbi:MAG: DUF1905 domain-containing protein [Actinophytocola sp.]|uniref:YdeI/OmpD-associated family protein n=1 Tax=Actinophytocola sp. TaxID=1872138 RepID=UPI0013214988|nr:YdeI/OmpD-associated family protein [Actinophytocola sp.]MPZ81491.1 DUF1905 domain-containing protein [Actinophytocola sp.]
MSGIEFDTELVKERNAVRLWLPAELAQRLGDERLVPAVVTINGTPVRTTLHKMNGGYMMAVNKAVQGQMGATAGDAVHVLVERDSAERTVEVPANLADALAKAGARDAFDKLTPFRQNELLKSVTSARTDDTRARRIDQAVQALTSTAG